MNFIFRQESSKYRNYKEKLKLNQNQKNKHYLRKTLMILENKLPSIQKLEIKSIEIDLKKVEKSNRNQIHKWLSSPQSKMKNWLSCKILVSLVNIHPNWREKKLYCEIIQYLYYLYINIILLDFIFNQLKLKKFLQRILSFYLSINDFFQVVLFTRYRPFFLLSIISAAYKDYLS